MADLNICRQAGDAFDVVKTENVCLEERTILADILAKLQLNENNWVEDDTILQNEPCCNWNHIKCEDGKMKEIDLASMGLFGTISPSIGKLTNPEILQLRNTQIGGEIPQEIGALSMLRELVLAHNRIQGTIPNNIGNLTKLELFQLHGNHFTGTVPEVIPVDEARYNLSSFTSDCGFPSLSNDPLVCTKCKMCCNSNDECTPRKDGFDMKNYLIGASVLLPFLLVGLPRTGVVFGPNEEATVKDLLEKIGLQSIYIFILSKNWILNILAAGIVILQTTVFFYFFRASVFEPNIDSDWEYTWECPMNELLCNKPDRSSSFFSSILIAVFIIITFIAQDGF